jgi:hypothetical protein
VRWHYRDPVLLWLFVAAYVAHVTEELWGGFPAWFAHVAGRPLPVSAFLAINAVGLTVLIGAVLAAIKRESLGWIAVAIATVSTINPLAHLLASIVTGTYSPGLVTGVVLWLPIAQLTLLRAWHQIKPSLFWRGIAAGVVAHLLVTAAAVAST